VGRVVDARLDGVVDGEAVESAQVSEARVHLFCERAGHGVAVLLAVGVLGRGWVEAARAVGQSHRPTYNYREPYPYNRVQASYTNNHNSRKTTTTASNNKNHHSHDKKTAATATTTSPASDPHTTTTTTPASNNHTTTTTTTAATEPHKTTTTTVTEPHTTTTTTVTRTTTNK